MLNVKLNKSADLTNPTQKAIALGMVGVALLVLWFILPPLITILTNVWIAIAVGAPLAFLIWNYQAVWGLFKRISWNFTKKVISSDKLWYLWQGYNWLLSENERMNEDIKALSASRMQSQKMLRSIVTDSNRATEEHALEKDPIKKRVLEVKVKMLNQQFENIEPKVLTAEQLEKDFIDYYNNRVADTEILKIKLDAMAQEYTLYKQMAKNTANASNWMKTSPEMKMFNESIRQIDMSLDTYTADIEDFKRNVLPKMSSNSTSRQLDAQEGAKLIEEYKKSRLLLTA